MSDKQAKGLEFIAMMALFMSLVALSIDAILPALSQIGQSLGVDSNNPNRNQQLLSFLFVGLSIGLIIYGPISDAYGRKNTIYLGITIFTIGSLVSLFAYSFNMMLLGRVLQGVGAASCRIVSIAMIRDRFEGAEMAKIMSLISVIFIVVPAIAPTIGQLILWFASWKAIFSFILTIALISVLWLHFRQPETLAIENRRALSIGNIKSAAIETITTPISFGYMLAAGLTFGSFVGYLSSSQQILQMQYQLGDAFALVFGGLALAIGSASFANSLLLKKYGMEQLCLFALSCYSIVSILFYCYLQIIGTQPPLPIFLIYLGLTFFPLGLLFGNFNALALKPLGHIAGTATSVISSIQTLIAGLIGGFIGSLYNNSVEPLVLGFAACGLAGLIITARLHALRS